MVETLKHSLPVLLTHQVQTSSRLNITFNKMRVSKWISSECEHKAKRGLIDWNMCMYLSLYIYSKLFYNCSTVQVRQLC